MKIRILIVDDHQMFRSGLKALLARQIEMDRSMKRIAVIACAAVVELAVHPETACLKSHEYTDCIAGVAGGGYKRLERARDDDLPDEGPP